MDLKDFNLAPFYLLDQEWALLTVGKKQNMNTMTISWGGFGTLWQKPVVTVYIRPSRYTYELMENHEYFTISFYDKEYQRELTLLGNNSGRDGNKIAFTKLTPDFLELAPSFKEANLTIVCKKIYFQDLNIKNINQDSISDIEIEHFYKKEPVHRMYIGEVIDIIDRRKGQL